MEKKTQKCISIKESTQKDISTLKTLLDVESDSRVIEILVAAEMKRQNGSDIEVGGANTYPSAAGGGICQKEEYGCLDSTAIAKSIEDIKSIMKQLVTITRGVDEKNYVMYDAINLYMNFIGADLPPYQSADTHLKFSNRDNRCEYFEKSHLNYEQRRLNAQKNKHDQL